MKYASSIPGFGLATRNGWGAGIRFRNYLRTVSYYTLLALVRQPNFVEAQARGVPHAQ